MGRTRDISQDDDEKPNGNMVNHEQLDGTELWISEELLQPEERIELQKRTPQRLFMMRLDLSLNKIQTMNTLIISRRSEYIRKHTLTTQH